MRQVGAMEGAAPGDVVIVGALVVVAPKVEDVDPVVSGSKSHQAQRNSRIDDRIGQSEKV